MQKIQKSASRKGEVVLLLRRETVMERSLGRAAENKTGLHLCSRVELFKTAAYHEREILQFLVLLPPLFLSSHLLAFCLLPLAEHPGPSAYTGGDSGFMASEDREWEVIGHLK